MSACCSALERAAVQGPSDRGRRRLLLRRRRQAGRHEQQPLRVLGPARADPRPKHAGPVARTCGRRTRRRVPAALPPEGVGDGHGARRHRLLRFCDVVPGEQALRQGAAQGRRLRRSTGARPLPLQQRHGARRAVRHAQQPEPRPGANRRGALRVRPPQRPPRQDVPHGHRDGRQDRGQVPILSWRGRPLSWY
jgi:hypothetical protein